MQKDKKKKIESDVKNLKIWGFEAIWLSEPDRTKSGQYLLEWLKDI